MTSGRGFSEDMRLAHVLADQADSISLDRFKAQDLKVDTKPDLTPVTDADRAVEEMLRITLSRARTRDAVMGEEFGTTGPRARARWVLDPIDGTKNFVRGVPVWATLIALFDGDEPVVGLVSAPALNRRWWAAKDVGAWTGRRLESATRCRVSEVTDAAPTRACPTPACPAGRSAAPSTASSTSPGRSGAPAPTATSGATCLLAEGAVDIACEPEVSLWDLAALDVIVREAGGRFTDLTGAPGPAGGSALATNGAPARRRPRPASGCPSRLTSGPRPAVRRRRRSGRPRRHHGAGRRSGTTSSADPAAGQHGRADRRGAAQRQVPHRTAQHVGQQLLDDGRPRAAAGEHDRLVRRPGTSSSRERRTDREGDPLDRRPRQVRAGRARVQAGPAAAVRPGRRPRRAPRSGTARNATPPAPAGVAAAASNSSAQDMPSTPHTHSQAEPPFCSAAIAYQPPDDVGVAVHERVVGRAGAPARAAAAGRRCRG